MKKNIGMVLCLALCILISGCSAQEKGKDKMYVYHINADGNALVQASCAKEDVNGALALLSAYSVLPEDVKIDKYELKNARLYLYFNAAYAQMGKSMEVLVRAAIVQTMVQVDGVDFVAFYIQEEPLKDNDGNAVGLMRAEDFVQNTGSSIIFYQTTDLTLYFSDKDGKQLKKSTKTNIRYNASTSIEKLVVEQLMKGTSSSGSRSTIPKTTKLLGVSVKEGICYVNFDSKFSLDSYDLDPEVTIYSIVNSIIENGNVTKVQILIDGASDVVYKNRVDLSRPLEWKADLIEE